MTSLRKPLNLALPNQVRLVITEDFCSFVNLKGLKITLLVQKAWQSKIRISEKGDFVRGHSCHKLELLVKIIGQKY